MTWFQPPQLRVGDGIEEESRRATWLELFYDLIYVVAVAQLGNNLHKDPTLTGFIGFVALFIPVWWSWIGATFYANRFDVDDVGHRLLTAVQMLAVAAMAVNIPAGLGEKSVGFALAYGFIRAMLVFQYLRAAQHVPQARPLARRYALGFAIAALCWLLSVAVPIPFRFLLWSLGIVIDVLTPITALKLQANLMPNLEHLPERFGLFTIIVLGEAVVAVVAGVAQEDWTLVSGLKAVMGFAIAFGLWWVYFENVGGTALRMAAERKNFQVFQAWLYGHFPLVIGIVAAGIGVKHVILAQATLSDGDRWLICGALALCLSGLAILHRTGVIFQCKARTKYRIAGAIALLGLAWVGQGWPPLAIMTGVVLVCGIQVGQDIYQGHPANWEAAHEI